MDIKLIKQELDKLNQIVSGWEDNGSAVIEQDIALELLKKIYTEIKFASPSPVAPFVPDTEEQEVPTTDTTAVEPQVEVEFIFDEDDAEPQPEQEVVEEEKSEQYDAPAEAASEEENDEVVFEEEDEQIVFEDESEEVIFEEEDASDEEEVVFEEEDEQEQEVFSDEEEIILEEEEEVEETPQPAQPAKNEIKATPATSIGNLFGEEETQQAPTRTKHQRMMSIYNDYEEEEQSVEQSVDISKIFELDDDEEFIINDGSEEEEFVVNHAPSIAEAKKQNDQGAILADVIAPAQTTIADSVEAPTAIADEMTNSPLKSLRDGIGINDKFLMIRDLFDGDGDEYERVIEQLDSLSSFDDCMIYIVENFAWNPESDGAKFIMKLLERKLA